MTTKNYGPMFQRAIDSGALSANTPGRVRLQKLIDRLPSENRGQDEAHLRGYMREASQSGLREIYYLGDGKRASVFTNPKARFAPEIHASLPSESLDAAERRMAEIDPRNLISAYVTTGKNSAGHTMIFEIVVPKYEADLLLTAGICFFQSPKVDNADGLMMILPGGNERFSHISTGDSAGVVMGTNYPGNAGKKTLMTIAGYVASQAGLLMEHFGLGVVKIRDPHNGLTYTFNFKVGGASFTGKTTTLTGEMADHVTRPGEGKLCLNDDMIFVDSKTGKAYGMEQGNFFTCNGLTEKSDRLLWKAQKDPRTIGYNLVVSNGEFDYHDPRSDPNARIAIPRGPHAAVDVPHINTEDIEKSSGRVDASIQLFRGPQFPPAFIMDPDMAAVWLAAGPTQKTAAQMGGSSLKVSGCHEFTPILNPEEAAAALENKTFPALQKLLGKEIPDQIAFAEQIMANRNSNEFIQTTQLIQDLFVSGFITEDARSYMDRLMGLYMDSGQKILHIGLNTGMVGPMVADAVIHPFEPARIRLHDFSVPLPPIISQDGYMHALRGEILTEYDRALGMHVIVRAGDIDMTQLLPRTRFKKAGIDYEGFVRESNKKYADFLEKNGIGDDYTRLLRSPPRKAPFVSISPEQRFKNNTSSFSSAKPESDTLELEIGKQLSVVYLKAGDISDITEQVSGFTKRLSEEDLLVDMSKFDFIDSSSIGQLVSLANDASSKERFMGILVKNKNVRNAIKRCTDTNVLHMFESEQAARVFKANFDTAKSLEN